MHVQDDMACAGLQDAGPQGGEAGAAPACESAAPDATEAGALAPLADIDLERRLSETIDAEPLSASDLKTPRKKRGRRSRAPLAASSPAGTDGLTRPLRARPALGTLREVCTRCQMCKKQWR